MANIITDSITNNWIPDIIKNINLTLGLKSLAEINIVTIHVIDKVSPILKNKSIIKDYLTTSTINLIKNITSMATKIALAKSLVA